MKLHNIGPNEAGQRLDKYLAKLLKEAPKSFTYKMLRKKNITLNGKKADGSEKLAVNDQVRLFLSDETYDKFCGRAAVERAETDLEILFEDADIVLINKPAGMLSQSTGDGTPSVNEYLIGYLLGKGAVTEETLKTFRPAVCNRLDRNTSGIIAAGKSLKGLQQLSRVFHDRTVHKDYLTLVDGVLKKEKKIKGYLIKDPDTNKVQILEQAAEEALPIETRYTPLGNNGSVTLLKVRLITGRAHQIRAHLAGIGHPILGDKKYASQKSVSSAYRHQLLHAYRLEFPEDMGELDTLKGKVVLAPLPEAFHKILTKEKLDRALEEVLSGNGTHTS